MIIAHFFLRVVRKQPTLFVETTSSRGLEQPSPAAQSICEVSLDENRANWIRKAYYAFTKKFKDLVLLDTLENSLRLESEHPSFDLVFVPRSEGAGDGKIGKSRRTSVGTVIRNLFRKKRESI